MSKSGISFNIEGLLNGLNNLEVKSASATRIYAETAKQKLVDESKENAPWTDRTGLSRQTIDGKVSNGTTETKIEIRGNTPQFKYLELCHEKKYAILWPTIKKNAQAIKNGWAKVVMK